MSDAVGANLAAPMIDNTSTAPEPTTKQRQLDYSNQQENASTARATASTLSSSTTDNSDTEQEQHSPSWGTPQPDVGEKNDTNWSQKVTELYQDDKLLEAARLLRTQVSKQNEESLTNEQRKFLHLASKMEYLIEVLDQEKEAGKEWNVVGGSGHESKSNGSPTIAYKVSDDHINLQIKVHQEIDPDLLIPLLSVLNETQLYEKWLPSFRGPPKFGIRRVNKVAQIGRCSQIILATFDPPWPLSPREIVLRAIAADDISSNGHIVIQIQSLSEDDPDDGQLVPPIDEPTICRLDFDGGFLFRTSESNEKIVVEFFYNLKSGVFDKLPRWLVKFFVSQIFWRSWNMFMKVAEDVRCGKRQAHAQAIEEKRETLYDWVDERIHEMMSKK